jgi:hypothetical protein
MVFISDKYERDNLFGTSQPRHAKHFLKLFLLLLAAIHFSFPTFNFEKHHQFKVIFIQKEPKILCYSPTRIYFGL